MAKDGDYAQLRLPSGEVRRFHVNCRAVVGQVGNLDHENVSLGKAGRNRWRGRAPSVRGVAMNPVDHPMGGGEGKSSGGRHPCSPWGKPTKGLKTRKTQAERQAHRAPPDEVAGEDIHGAFNQEGPVRRRAARAEDRDAEPQRGEAGASRPGRGARRCCPSSWATRSRCTTATSSSRSTSPRTWSATSSASSCPTRVFRGHGQHVAEKTPGARRTREVEPCKRKPSSGTCGSPRASATRCSTSSAAGRGERPDHAAVHAQGGSAHRAEGAQVGGRERAPRGQGAARGPVREGSDRRGRAHAEALAAPGAGARDPDPEAHEPRRR